MADRNDRAADPRIGHDAALEEAAAGLVEHELAQQVDAAGGGLALLAVGELVQRDVAQRADDQVRPFQMPRNAPTVSSMSPSDSTAVENSTMTWEPPTETTRPSGASAVEADCRRTMVAEPGEIIVRHAGSLRARSVLESLNLRWKPAGQVSDRLVMA